GETGRMNWQLPKPALGPPPRRPEPDPRRPQPEPNRPEPEPLHPEPEPFRPEPEPFRPEPEPLEGGPGGRKSHEHRGTAPALKWYESALTFFGTDVPKPSSRGTPP